MFHINKNTDTYKVVAGGISCAIGFGASLLTHTLCNTIIGKCGSGLLRLFSMKFGAIGLDLAVMYEVSTLIYDELDEIVDKINKLDDMVEIFEQINTTHNASVNDNTSE